MLIYLFQDNVVPKMHTVTSAISTIWDHQNVKCLCAVFIIFAKVNSNLCWQMTCRFLRAMGHIQWFQTCGSLSHMQISPLWSFPFENTSVCWHGDLIVQQSHSQEFSHCGWQWYNYSILYMSGYVWIFLTAWKKHRNIPS